MSGKETPATTWAKAAESKQMWERLQTLIQESFENIKAWMKNTAFPALQDLAKLLAGDLSSHKTIWIAMESVDLVTTHRKAYSKKINNIEFLVSKMEE